MKVLVQATTSQLESFTKVSGPQPRMNAPLAVSAYLSHFLPDLDLNVALA